MMDPVQLSGREDEVAPAGLMEGRFFVGETSRASSRFTPRWSRTSKSNAAAKPAVPSFTIYAIAAVNLRGLQSARLGVACQVDGLRSSATSAFDAGRQMQ